MDETCRFSIPGSIIMGVNVDSVKFKAFFASGVFCFFGSILQLCYAGSVSATINMGTMNIVFKPLMGVIIGMMLLRLVDNMPLMIFIGELVIAIIFNGFIALGMSSNIQNIVLGVFLLVALAISSNSAKIAEFNRKRLVRNQAIVTRNA